MTFGDYLYVISAGMGIGFTIGFILWALGFTVYSIIKWFKLSVEA